MLQVKKGVTLSGLKEEMLHALDVATTVYNTFNADCVLTSGKEEGHGDYSHHYKGLAIDLRTWVLDSTYDKQKVVKALQRLLGTDYQVILENLNRTQEHIHIEYDPRQI